MPIADLLRGYTKAQATYAAKKLGL